MKYLKAHLHRKVLKRGLKGIVNLVLLPKDENYKNIIKLLNITYLLYPQA